MARRSRQTVGAGRVVGVVGAAIVFVASVSMGRFGGGGVDGVDVGWSLSSL